jgi:hypothetical protein
MQGRLTGKSNGTLNYKKFSFLLNFPGYGEALFENQYGINSKTNSNFAQQGDSGAIVLDDQNYAIGLVIGVASQIDLAFVNPIDPILTYFSVEIA